MGEVNGDFDGRLNVAGDEEEDERVHEWELGLPNFADIAPLSQGLIPLELLSAFNIKPEPYRTSVEVTQASEDTLSILCGTNYKDFCEDNDDDESGTKKQRRTDSPEDADSAAADVAAEAAIGGCCGGGGGGGEKAVKRSRLVWTPQLHKRFVDVVGHLGIKSAVPKTIMQLMNVEGLTRENVASHLQKYRLYLKRMQGVSFDGGSNSSSENGNGNGAMSVSVPVMPVPMMGMTGMGVTGMGNYKGYEQHQNHNNNNNNNNYSHNNSFNNNNNNSHYNHHQFSNGNGMMMQSGNKYGSMVSYHHPPTVGPGNN